MAQETSQHTPDTSPTLFSKVMSWAAYPVAALAGWRTVKRSVEDGVYERLKRDGVIEDIRQPLMETRKEFGREANLALGVSEEVINRATSRPLPIAVLEGAARDFTSRSNSADKAYFKQYEKRVEEVGLKPFVEKWKFVHRSHREGAVMNGMFMSSVLLGAMLGIADSKTLDELLRRKEKPHGVSGTER